MVTEAMKQNNHTKRRAALLDRRERGACDEGPFMSGLIGMGPLVFLALLGYNNHLKRPAPSLGHPKMRTFAILRCGMFLAFESAFSCVHFRVVLLTSSCVLELMCLASSCELEFRCLVCVSFGPALVGSCRLISDFAN